MSYVYPMLYMAFSHPGENVDITYTSPNNDSWLRKKYSFCIYLEYGSNFLQYLSSDSNNLCKFLYSLSKSF